MKVFLSSADNVYLSCFSHNFGNLGILPFLISASILYHNNNNIIIVLHLNIKYYSNTILRAGSGSFANVFLLWTHINPLHNGKGYLCKSGSVWLSRVSMALTTLRWWVQLPLGATYTEK